MRTFSLMAACLVALGACGEGNESQESDPDSGTSQSCDQSCQDNTTSSGAIELVSFLYNQNLAGQPVGVQDFTVDCPLGGTAHGTGTNGFDQSTGVISVNLSYDLSGCTVSDSAYTLGFDGVISQTGTLEQQGQISIAYIGSAFSFEGNIQGDPVSASDCELGLQERRDSNNMNYRVSGLLCGRAVSY